MEKKLYLSMRDRKIAGVCGGIAEFFGLDSSLVRLAYIVLTICSAAFPGLLIYLLAWWIVPKEPLNPNQIPHN
jgi:phage shock protein C